ncbi:hypothetical protein E4U28_004207 [Claviceps purpurea]|nr:hypothetical protein E4U28_004207 [Claviceps purpurea]
MSEHCEPRGSRAGVIVYTILRALQVAALITIITITARHVSYVKGAGFQVPQFLAAIFAFAVTMVVYCVIAYILYWAVRLLQRWYNRVMFTLTVIDGFGLIYNVMVAGLMGYNYWYKQITSCNDLNNTDNKAEYLRDLYRQYYSGRLQSVNADRATCVESGRIFGLTISLCILFFATISLGARLDDSEIDI